jgi:glutamate racemase
MEPAVKPAVAATRSGVVGVLATTGTLASARFAALLERYAGEVEIVTQGCPGLVEQVERGDLAGPATRALIMRYTKPLQAIGADTLILGCTHYPFLAPLISETVGTDMVLVDTGAAVARQLQRRLQTGLTASVPRVRHEPVEGPELAAGQMGHVQFFTSGDTVLASRIMSMLWGGEIRTRQLPDEFL